MLGGLHRRVFKRHGVGMADLIQFAAKHAVVSALPSPFLNPQIYTQLTPPSLPPHPHTSIPCKDPPPHPPNPLNPLPSTNAPALSATKTTTPHAPHALPALLRAYTTSTAHHINTTHTNTPQDSRLPTPGVWDTLCSATRPSTTKPSAQVRFLRRC